MSPSELWNTSMWNLLQEISLLSKLAAHMDGGRDSLMALQAQFWLLVTPWQTYPKTVVGHASLQWFYLYALSKSPATALHRGKGRVRQGPWHTWCCLHCTRVLFPCMCVWWRLLGSWEENFAPTPQLPKPPCSCCKQIYHIHCFLFSECACFPPDFYWTLV